MRLKKLEDIEKKITLAIKTAGTVLIGYNLQLFYLVLLIFIL